MLVVIYMGANGKKIKPRKRLESVMGVGLSREVPFKDFEEQAWQSWGTEEKLE